MHLRSRLLVVGFIAAATLWGRGASAQTVSASGAPYPNRIVNGVNLGVSTRPQNLNPLGVSYADCNENMQLQFSVEVSGFAGQNLAVWVSKTSTCDANPQDRGIGTGGNVCWFLQQPLTGYNSSTLSTITVTLNVRDIVGEQNATVPVTSFVPQGASACLSQPSFTAVTFNVNFVPLDAEGNLSGTAYSYVLNVDMVGPPAPANPSETVGDTLFNVMWTPNIDTDTAGYDVFITPIPGQEEAGVVVPVRTIEVCPDATVAESDAEEDGMASDGAPTDAMTSTDAKTSSSSDAGCHFINVASTGEAVDGNTSESCPGAAVLGAAVVQDASTSLTATEDGAILDEDASEVEDEAGTESGFGGISTVPTQNIVNFNNGAGETISDKTASQYTITGLENGVTYTVAVAAVDAYGNVGPSSSPVCDFPAPTEDFWQNYKNDGGGAGGGFCALEAAGAPVPSMAGAAFLVSAAAIARRRKRRGAVKR